MSDQPGQLENKKPGKSKAEMILSQYYWVFFTAAAIGLAAILLFPFQASSIGQYFGVLTTALLSAVAFLALGALAGFLFGIPYANQAANSASLAEQEPEKPVEPAMKNAPVFFKPYRPNTNLEQISDWLTKILVGVGLVQLSQVPGALQAYGAYVSAALGGWKTSAIFGSAILLYFLVLGFLLLFLWTRVNLPLLYAQSDVDQNQAYEMGKQEGMLDGEKNAVNALGNKISLAPPTGVTRDIGSGGSPKRKRLLWVDDQPMNNANEMRILRDTLPVDIDTSPSTKDALEKFTNNIYDLVISDLGRPEGRRAGLELLSKIREKPDTIPFIIYSRVATPEIDAQAARLRAKTTNSPLALIEKATNVLKG